MITIVVATTKTWNIEHAYSLKSKLKEEKFKVVVITDRELLTTAYLKKIMPQYIFFPHWSWIIPAEVYDFFECIVFHMTDLPYGRGGSPLQNLIVRGVGETKISAIRVTAGIDEGPIYFKEKLNLNGTAEEILLRAADIVFYKMIPRLISEKIEPIQQIGESVVFKRRKPSESEIPKGLKLNQVYDYIRMLDGEGYPTAYIQYGNYKLKFARATLKQGKIIADVEWEIERSIDE